MPANPEILSALNDHVFNKTGKRVLDLPETGGDKDKPKTPERIPLPDYKDPESRKKYAQEFHKKYGELTSGLGDTPLRINEKAFWASDTGKNLSTKTAAQYKMDPALLYTSAMVEGMSGLYPNEKNQANTTGDKEFPVSALWSFGLDSFDKSKSDSLVKKGYLPKDFQNQYKIFEGEGGPTGKDVRPETAMFKTTDAGLQAKAAMFKETYDDIDSYAQKKGIKLTPKARDFFALANFNGGEGTSHAMLNEYNKKGLLKDDQYLQHAPDFGEGDEAKKYKKVFTNAKQRLVMADALKNEGYFDQPTPPQQQPPNLFQSNKKAFVDSTLQANKHLDWVQRLHEKNAPSIQIQGEPERSTHFMGDDGKGYVFPTVVRQNGKLVYLGDKAEDYARQTKTGIQFSKEQGDWFANNGYKTGTGVNNSINPQGVPFNDPKYTIQH